jgi:hypothetical protein
MANSTDASAITARNVTLGHAVRAIVGVSGNAKGDVKDDAEGLRTMHTLGANMAWLMKRLAD